MKQEAGHSLPLTSKLNVGSRTELRGCDQWTLDRDMGHTLCLAWLTKTNTLAGSKEGLSVWAGVWGCNLTASVKNWDLAQSAWSGQWHKKCHQIPLSLMSGNEAHPQWQREWGRGRKRGREREREKVMSKGERECAEKTKRKRGNITTKEKRQMTSE